VFAVIATRTWTLTIPAPARMFSINTSEHWRVTGAAKKAWREAAFLYARQAKLPTGLARIRIDIVLHFTNNSRGRDTANYHPHVGKPLTDGLAAGRTVKAKTGVRIEPGYGLVADDTPAHLDGPHLLIGEPVSRKQHPFGLAILTITDLSGDAS
jgi:hypothetical protein